MSEERTFLETVRLDLEETVYDEDASELDLEMGHCIWAERWGFQLLGVADAMFRELTRLLDVVSPSDRERITAVLERAKGEAT